MKKQIALILAGALTVCMASCSGNQAFETTIHTTESEKDAIILQATEGTTETNATPSFVKETIGNNVYYPNGDPFSETPTRLLYVQSGIIHYLNKVTEERQIFCFDPLCNHSGPDECIAHKFMMADSGIQSIEYCEYDNRFYALRGAQLCSFSFDGSDLKVECSFGEEGKFGTNKHGVYMYGDLSSLSVHGQYVYFFAKDHESGNFALTRFDVKNKELKRIFCDENTNFGGYFVSGDTLYISMVGNYSGVYRAALDGSGLEKISDNIYADFSTGIFGGETVYLVESYNGIYKKIVAFTPENNLFEDVMLIEDGVCHTLLATTNQYLYFTKREPISVGYYGTDEIFNYTSRIYRLDKESGEIETVLDDMRCSANAMYFIEGTVLILGSAYVPDEIEAFSNGGGFTAKLDENGMFTELKQLAEK